MRERLPALALFEGVADEDVLASLSGVNTVPARFASVTKEVWSASLRRLADIGLLTALGGGTYGLHPALPPYLMAEWRRMAGEGFASEHGAAEAALLTAYSGFGSWLSQQIGGGSAEGAYSLIERQRRTMGRLLGFALSAQRYAEAQALMQPLDEFWDVRGLGAEARGWVDRCRKALEAADGAPPALDSAAGALWLFAVGAEANRAHRAGSINDRISRLTPREREVLTHVIAGRLNKQIAADLGTVEKTIKLHRGRMMHKMGVRTVADLVRIAERAGIRPSHRGD
jgi:DNA-binding CsgD family transcriptional regulator